MRRAKSIIASGGLVCVYPEGRHSVSGVAPFNVSIFRVAQQLELPLVCAGLAYESPNRYATAGAGLIPGLKLSDSAVTVAFERVPASVAGSMSAPDLRSLCESTVARLAKGASMRTPTTVLDAVAYLQETRRQLESAAHEALRVGMAHDLRQRARTAGAIARWSYRHRDLSRS